MGDTVADASGVATAVGSGVALGAEVVEGGLFVAVIGGGLGVAVNEVSVGGAVVVEEGLGAVRETVAV